MSECFEWLLESSALERAYFKELESNCLSEGLAVFRSDDSLLLEVDLVCDNDTSQVPSLVLLFDALEPLSEELEGIGVGDVVD